MKNGLDNLFNQSFELIEGTLLSLVLMANCSTKLRQYS